METETLNKLNGLLTKSFLFNMICDNLVYQIDDAEYHNIANIVHVNFAHKWPEFADEISDIMSKLSVRPIRGDLSYKYTDHNGDLNAIFEEIYEASADYRQEIIETIDISELNGDVEVKIFLEELLMKFLPYFKQVRTWSEYAKKYDGDYKTFDVRFEKITTYIDI